MNTFNSVKQISIACTYISLYFSISQPSGHEICRFSARLHRSCSGRACLFAECLCYRISDPNYHQDCIMGALSIIVLGVLCIAHLALLYRTMFIVVSEWEASSEACVVVQTNPSMLNTTFFFSNQSIYYFSCILKYRHFTSISHGLWFYYLYLYLHCNRPPLQAFGQNRSPEASFQDGLVYFLASFSTNCVPAVSKPL